MPVPATIIGRRVRPVATSSAAGLDGVRGDPSHTAYRPALVVTWGDIDWVTVVLVAAAVAAPVVSWLLWRHDKGERERDARARAAERDEDRAERNRDRAERQAERRSAVIDVRLLHRPGVEPDERRGQPWVPSENWWRLSLVGGNAFSRVTVTRFDKRNVDSDEDWRPAVHQWPGPFTLGTGQTAHFKALIALGERPEIIVEWTHDGDDQHFMRRPVFREPWT